MQTDLNSVVQTLIDDLVASGEEVGLQVAAYVDGKLVVDAWAGIADEASGRFVDGNTLFTTWSTTKGFVATCIHILADRGKLDYDAPVAAYWPEFAANGKEGVTVRHLLMHQAGIPHMPDGVTAEMMTDWDAMCRAIANHEPLWEPGTKKGYHAWTFGWLLGEVIRRIDGRPIEKFCQEELCQPLGITDFYMGIPDEVEDRVATLRQHPAHLQNANSLDAKGQRVMPPHVTNAEVVNRGDFRRAVVPGGGGIMTARAIARHYAMLAGHGILDGVRILSAERVDMIRAPQPDLPDWSSNEIRSRRSLGYVLGGDLAQGADISQGSGGGEFGHGGNGGSLGFADPERNFSFGLAKTLMRFNDDPRKGTSYRVAEAIRQQLPPTS